MKTQEELNQLKKEYEEFNKKFQELSEEEIIQSKVNIYKEQSLLRIPGTCLR